MTTINISLPDQMKDFVDEQVGEGGYGTASEYLRALLTEQQKRKAEEKLEGLLLEGLSTKASTLESKDWEHVRGELKQRIAKRDRKAS
jgi:antitoxin ParD1/3/4